MTRAVFARVFDKKTAKGARDPAKCSLTPPNPAKNRRKRPETTKKTCISASLLELIAGIEPANLILTKDALYLLSYISMLSIGQRIYINTVLRKKQEGKSTFFKILSHFFAPAAFQVCRGVFVSDDARQMAFVRQ